MKEYVYTITTIRFTNVIDTAKNVFDISHYVSACIEMGQIQDPDADRTDEIFKELMEQARLNDKDYDDDDDILLHKAQAMARKEFDELFSLYNSDKPEHVELILNKFNNDGCTFYVEEAVEED
jgi:hypothetical protein